MTDDLALWVLAGIVSAYVLTAAFVGILAR
jgi:hypothetical protein